MKKIYLLAALAMVLVIPTSNAQEGDTRASFEASAETTRFELSTIGELQADGWQEAAPDVWRKTFDNGDEGEITFGTAAYEQASARIGAKIETLELLKHRDDAQELQLIELLLNREKLEQVKPLSRGLCVGPSCGLCTGTATFDHALVRPNFAYPFVQAKSTFNRWWNVGTALAYAEASFSAGSYFDDDSASSSGNSILLTATAIAGGTYPTFSCTGEAWGLVEVSGNGLPSYCYKIAIYSRTFSC